jgi:hypothetical protein
MTPDIEICVPQINPRRNLSGEASGSSASQRTFRILWNPVIHCRMHNSLPPDPALHESNPGPLFCYKLRVNIILPATPRSSKWSLAFQGSSFTHAACPTNLIVLTISGADIKWRSSLLCSTLYSTLTSLLLGPDFFFNTKWSCLSLYITFA